MKLIGKITFVLLVITLITACGGGPPATVATLPLYPGATELQAGESTIADTLGQNNATDAAMREAMGVGGSTEQKGYRLPADATWDQVKAYYDEQLKGQGWQTNSTISAVMEQANAGNDVFRTANWQKGGQNVTVVMLTLPTDATQKELIVSLSSQ
ncbi:hypothetical protein HC891_12090 [Candidatus Gracilibacteria bacterium]|nr:hypothetical protein [Candidatus Gracilibacteria bacterium]